MKNWTAPRKTPKTSASSTDLPFISVTITRVLSPSGTAHGLRPDTGESVFFPKAVVQRTGLKVGDLCKTCLVPRAPDAPSFKLDWVAVFAAIERVVPDEFPERSWLVKDRETGEILWDDEGPVEGETGVLYVRVRS